MVKRTSLEGAACPVARSLDAIGDWWSLLIVRDAFDGMRRFGEFQKSLGMAKNILAQRLRTLVGHGILEAVAAADGGAHREYVLTPKGMALFPVVLALRQWGEAHFYAPDEPRSVLIERHSGKPVAPMRPCRHDRQPLAPQDTLVRKVHSEQEEAAAPPRRKARSKQGTTDANRTS